MSRLRRLVVSDRWFFVTCRVLPRRHLSDLEFACLAQVIRKRREKHGFLLSAWVFLAGHGHALFYPAQPLTIGRVMESIKDAATKRINSSRHEAGRLLQPRFFDRAQQRQWLGGDKRRNTSQAQRSGRLVSGLSSPILAR